MTQFRVWAPKAETVALVIDDDGFDMTSDSGYFAAEIDVPTGTRYGYSLDGGPVLPDPRSPYQPDGVHGRSYTVDHDAFEWTDHDWTGVDLADAVIYELHVGTFTAGGTFDSAIERLDHLCELGVTLIEVMPIAEFPGTRGWGYDGVDLFAPHHAYGGPDGFKCFVDACHVNGLGVLLDVVYNHLGPDGNYLPQFGPYFSGHHHTLWGDGVNFDADGSEEVRKFVIDNALMWVRDYHCDGLRLDAVHAIVDESPAHILDDLATAVHDFDKRKLVIAESESHDEQLVTRFGLDGVWNDDFHHALHVRLTGEHDGYYKSFVGDRGFPGAQPPNRWLSTGKRVGGPERVHRVHAES